MSNSPIVVADTAIRQDADGRFSLNDLHRAAGAESRHQPANFLRLDSTMDLCTELDRSSDVRNGQSVSTSRGGTGQGTFVAKELVYAYAMWISPAFHLKVIRAYDALSTNAAIPESVQRLLDLIHKGIEAERGTMPAIVGARRTVKKRQAQTRNLHIAMPLDLHHETKRAALDRGITLRELVLGALRRDLGRTST